MRIHDKMYTLMVGSLLSDGISESYGVVDDSDSNGIPALMFIESNGMRVENNSLYHTSEELLRKAIKRGIQSDGTKSVVFLVEIAYDDTLTLSKLNSSCISLIEPFTDLYKSRLKDFTTQKHLDDILKEHYIRDIFTVEKQLPIYGKRNVVGFVFDMSIKELGNLDTNIPEDTNYMDNIVSFLHVVKNAIVAEG